MSKKFPLDEFDQLLNHGGRHRIRRTGGDRVREFFRYMLISLVVATLGYFGFTWVDSGNLFSAPAPTNNVQVDATKGYPVTVLDGTGTAGTASGVAHKVLDAGWSVVTADKLPKKTNKTVIYYSNVDYKATAQSLTAVVGKYPTKLDANYSDPITVVLGADFQK